MEKFPNVLEEANFHLRMAQGHIQSALKEPNVFKRIVFLDCAIDRLQRAQGFLREWKGD